MIVCVRQEDLSLVRRRRVVQSVALVVTSVKRVNTVNTRWVYVVQRQVCVSRLVQRLVLIVMDPCVVVMGKCTIMSATQRVLGFLLHTLGLVLCLRRHSLDDIGKVVRTPLDGVWVDRTTWGFHPKLHFRRALVDRTTWGFHPKPHFRQVLVDRTTWGFHPRPHDADASSVLRSASAEKRNRTPSDGLLPPTPPTQLRWQGERCKTPSASLAVGSSPCYSTTLARGAMHTKRYIAIQTNIPYIWDGCQ